MHFDRRLAAIVAFQRSGTHLLGSCVGSHPDLRYPGEIFARKPRETEEQVRHIIDHTSAGPNQILVMDVKLNQITPPLELLLDKIPVIGLRRNDRRRAYYSGELHTFWGRHPKAKAKGVRPAFDFNPEKFAAIEARYDRLWDRYSYLVGLELVYEDLTGNEEIQQLPVWAEEKICEFLDVDLCPLTTDIRKDAPSEIDGLLR